MGVETTGLPAARYSTSFTGTRLSLKAFTRYGTRHTRPSARMRGSSACANVPVSTALGSGASASAAAGSAGPAKRSVQSGSSCATAAASSSSKRNPSAPAKTAVRSAPSVIATGASSDMSTAAVASLTFG